MWFQRSREKWLISGGRNTRYYHLKVVNRKRKNKVSLLRKDQGDWGRGYKSWLMIFIKTYSQNHVEKVWYQSILCTHLCMMMMLWSGWGLESSIEYGEIQKVIA